MTLDPSGPNRGIVEIVLGVLGLALALYQIRKVEKAAVAARNAVVDAASNANRFSFLLLVPELALVEHNLDRAIESDDRSEVLRLLRDWQIRSSELRGLLEVFALATDELKVIVSESIGQASTAHAGISKGKPIDATASKARKSAEAVTLRARSDAQAVRASITSQRESTTIREDVISWTRAVWAKLWKTGRRDPHG